MAGQQRMAVKLKEQQQQPKIDPRRTGEEPTSLSVSLTHSLSALQPKQKRLKSRNAHRGVHLCFGPLFFPFFFVVVTTPFAIAVCVFFSLLFGGTRSAGRPVPRIAAAGKEPRA